MGVIGSSGGGYATVNPTQGNAMGEAMQNVENSAFKYRAEKREQEQIKSQEEREIQENRRRDFIESQKFTKDNPFIATGTGLDAVNRQSYMNAKDAASKAYSEYMKTGDVKHQAIYENAVASVNNISAIPKQINALKENWVTNAKDYNPESLKRKASILDQIASGQIVQTNDANGNPRYTVFEKDENGNISKLNQKDISGEQLLKSLNPEKAFNVDGKDGLIDLFNRNIGKERKVIIGTGINAKEKTYNPGAEELAAIMAKDAVEDHSKMYEVLTRMGLDPENEKNYSDAKIKENASKYIQDMLMVTAPTSISNKPDTSIEMLNLAKTREYNDQVQRGIDNDFKTKEFNEKQLERKTVTVGTTEYKFTDIGVKAKKEFYAKPENKGKNMTSEDWPAGSFKVVRTSMKETSKTPSSNPKPRPNSKSKTESEKSTKKQINRSEIAEKAKAAGYSTKEYEALLIKNGITIK